jgi:hypothetical protein
MDSSVIVLRCTECGLPYARVVNGVLVVESRHHGEKHTSVIAIAELDKLAEDADHKVDVMWTAGGRREWKRAE